MHLIRRVIGTIIFNVAASWYWYFSTSKVSLSKNKKNIVVFGIPHYGNLGDQAIVLAEKRFLSDKFSDSRIIYVAEEDTLRYLKSISNQVGLKDVVMYQGGGNLGSLYPIAERNRRIVAKRFRDKKIVFFPQSIFFEDSLIGKFEQKLSQSSYKKCSDLTIVAREKRSFEKGRLIFPENECILTPDIVLYLLNKVPIIKKKDKEQDYVLKIFRSDDEKVITSSDSVEIQRVLSTVNKTIRDTDTVISEKVNEKNRKDLVLKKLTEIGNAKFIVTDRLHGMVFSLLEGVPCIVFMNNNGKISSVIESWIPEDSGVYVADMGSFQQVFRDCVKGLGMKRASEFSLDTNFEPLSRVINL